jgi:YkoY family integral membrane protein
LQPAATYSEDAAPPARQAADEAPRRDFPHGILDPVIIEPGDILTIALLVLLEGLLSADNALVLAVLVLGLPRVDQRKALRYGIVGAFVFRGLATVFAAWMIGLSWVKLLGAAYLFYLPYKHFFHSGDAVERRRPKPARTWLGLSAFWATVVRVELTDIVFAIDSILVAVAMSNKLWVIVTGGLLGIVAMRLLIGQLLLVVQRYPAIVDGAFIIIAWVGFKLLVEYLHQIHVVAFEIPKWLSLGLIVVIFGIAWMYARRAGPMDDADSLDDAAAELLLETDFAEEPSPPAPSSSTPSSTESSVGRRRAT